MNSSALQRDWARCVLVAILAAGFCGACKDKQKCDEAVQTTRQAISVENMPLARQWRDFTWKVCGDSALQSTIDQEILTKEKDIQTRADDAAKKAHDTAQDQLNQATAVWRAFDKLDAKDQTPTALKDSNSKAKRLARGLDDAYAKQVQDYNTAQYQKRLKALDPALK